MRAESETWKESWYLNILVLGTVYYVKYFLIFLSYQHNFGMIHQDGENKRKRQQELDQQRVASQVAELKMAKQELEQEVDTHKKRLRLHMEAQVRTQSNTWKH